MTICRISLWGSASFLRAVCGVALSCYWLYLPSLVSFIVVAGQLAFTDGHQTNVMLEMSRKVCFTCSLCWLACWVLALC